MGEKFITALRTIAAKRTREEAEKILEDMRKRVRERRSKPGTVQISYYTGFGEYIAFQDGKLLRYSDEPIVIDELPEGKPVIIQSFNGHYKAYERMGGLRSNITEEEFLENWEPDTPL